MNRLYVVEPTPTSWCERGSSLAFGASEVELFARALAGSWDRHIRGASPDAQKWLGAVAKDLQKRKGASLVVAGEQQPAEVHALAHAINAASATWNDALLRGGRRSTSVNHLESLRELCADIEAGKVETLVILGANPVTPRPTIFDFTSKMASTRNKAKKVKNTICVSSHFDELPKFAIGT